MAVDRLGDDISRCSFSLRTRHVLGRPIIVVGGLRFHCDSICLVSVLFFRPLPSTLAEPDTCSDVSAILKSMSEM